jgi:hypothetical protein
VEGPAVHLLASIQNQFVPAPTSVSPMSLIDALRAR